MYRFFRIGCLFGLSLLFTLQIASAGSPEVFSHDGAAIRGYDPVAYHTVGEPAKGSSDYTLTWNDSLWMFSSQENLDLFTSDPEKYAPRYGGYCAWAAAKGYIASTIPEAWAIHEGQLYLNYSRRIQRRWSRDIPGNIAKGDLNWPGILSN